MRSINGSISKTILIRRVLCVCCIRLTSFLHVSLGSNFSLCFCCCSLFRFGTIWARFDRLWYWPSCHRYKICSIRANWYIPNTTNVIPSLDICFLKANFSFFPKGSVTFVVGEMGREDFVCCNLVNQPMWCTPFVCLCVSSWYFNLVFGGDGGGFWDVKLADTLLD